VLWVTGASLKVGFRKGEIENGVFVNFDLKQMGVAGENSLDARPYEEYLVPAQDYRFEFTLEPVF